MSKILYNKSKTYLLPLIAQVLDLDMKFMPYLLNTYMFDENHEYHDCILILHEFSFKNPDFTSYEHKLTKNDLFVKCIDIGDKVLYVFKFPEEYLKEFYYLYNSQYSKFGDDAKELILRFWGSYYSGNPLGVQFLIKVKQILYKDTKLKEKIEEQLSSKDHKVKLDDNQELGEHVNVENETFKLEQFVESKI